MNKKEQFDICTWIRSDLIREGLRKKSLLAVMKQAEIVHNGYGSVEDKLRALVCLRHRAKTKQEKKYMRRIVTYYQAALRQIGMEGKSRSSGEQETGEIWMGRCGEYQFGVGGHYDYFTDIDLFYSFQEARQWAGQHLSDPWQVCRLEKWILRKENPACIMECFLRRVEDKLCVTHVYMDEEELGLKSIEEFDHLSRHPCKLPFSTGDLVKLDGPAFKTPVFGVFCDDLWDVQYYWMGRLLTEKEKKGLKKHEGRLYNGSSCTTEDLSYLHVDGFYQLCVMDWLRLASEEELSGEQKILAEMGRELRGLRGEDRVAVERFFEIFSWYFL